MTVTRAAVVDASALAAFLFGEPEAERVEKQIRGRALFAPALIDYELASVCRSKAARHPQARDLLLRGLATIADLPLDRVDVPPLEMYSLSEQTGLTPYDAAYLWVARRLGLDLVTLDRRLSEAFSSARR